ncbi:hypothetical protein OK016_01625 [Vibrio chagasii]|nr:hypothetical protein [Vibrio chagasii]
MWVGGTESSQTLQAGVPFFYGTSFAFILLLMCLNITRFTDRNQLV